MEEERGTVTVHERGPGSLTRSEALADCLEGGEADIQGMDMGEAERAELEALLYVADRLDARLRPVRPSPAFVESLGQELVAEAERRMLKREKRHRVAVISAAVAGGIVSLVSLVGGIVMLVKWLRTRSEARQASTA